MNITISDVSVVNDTNEITVEVNITSILENIRQFEYIYVVVALLIPITESDISKNIMLRLAEEHETAPYNEQNNNIVMNTEFAGQYDSTREVTANCHVIGYNKTTNSG